MPGNFTNFLEDAFLEHLFDQSSFATPDLYVSLHTGNPGETGGYEVTGTGYTRVYTYFLDWLLTASGVIQNNDEIVFPMADDYWGWITYFGLYNAASSGNLLVYGPLTPSEEIDFGDIVKFAVYDLTVTLD